MDPDEAMMNENVWRATAMKFLSGGMSGFSHTEYLFNDRVLESHISAYIQEAVNRRNVTKIVITKLGPLRDNWNWEPRAGTVPLARQKKNSKLEAYL